ncbi:23S rRNA (adenine(1618)-N(6))-methyltransferase RlmF [soil metagenome]
MNEEKTNLHSRNAHRKSYDFTALIKTSPELAPFVVINRYGNSSVNFADPKAVKALNRALLLHFYKLTYWDIPDNYLCPPIPGRADYIHYAADLLRVCNDNVIPMGTRVAVIDIGTGANLVYPIIGNKEYGWRFVGSEIDPLAILAAEKIIKANPALAKDVECRLQKSTYNIFRDVVQPGEQFDLSICNPPFHASAYDADTASLRKLEKMGRGNEEPVKNFGGQSAELWTPGGEEAFINRMIKESMTLKNDIFWFTTLVSKRETLDGITESLKAAKVFDMKIVGMSQGQKISRIIAWTFLDEAAQEEWKMKRWKKAAAQ